jgi:transposase-like protein
VRDRFPRAAHRVERQGSNAVESDHARVKARLGVMHGLKRMATATVIIAGHAFVQNVRRGHYFVGGKHVPELLRVKRTLGKPAAVV